MTVVADSETTARTEQAEPRAQTLTLEEQAIQAIWAESGCDDTTARLLIGMSKRVANSHPWLSGLGWTRKHVLLGYELDITHPTLAIVMPDGQDDPKRGSAHDLINRLCGLLPGESMIHGKTGLDRCKVTVLRRRCN